MESPEDLTSTSPTPVTREELREMLDRPDDFDLLMAGSNFSYGAKHIPGSKHFARPEDVFAAIAKDRTVVVYCSNIDCNASNKLTKALREHGYTNVRHYPGGIIEWEDAGLPLEGEWVK